MLTIHDNRGSVLSTYPLLSLSPPNDGELYSIAIATTITGETIVFYVQAKCSAKDIAEEIVFYVWESRCESTARITYAAPKYFVDSELLAPICDKAHDAELQSMKF